MSNGKGNGETTMESFMQSENIPPFKGEEKRANRANLTPVDQLIVDALRGLKEDVKEIKACKDDCNLGELKNHIVHIDDVIVEKGKGKGRTQGINNFRDQDKDVEKILSTRSKATERIFLIVVGALAILALKKIGWV